MPTPRGRRIQIKVSRHALRPSASLIWMRDCELSTGHFKTRDARLEHGSSATYSSAAQKNKYKSPYLHCGQHPRRLLVAIYAVGQPINQLWTFATGGLPAR